MMSIDRRSFNKLALGGVSFAALWCLTGGKMAIAQEDLVIKVEKTDEEWKKILTPEQYDVLRHDGTERAFTSPLNDEKRAGTYVCAGCDLPLFPSRFKYESGTGWPSFYNVIPFHVEKKADNRVFMSRVEYHCARCNGHQGHLFTDGPIPTGIRYCNNGASLKFIPAPSQE